MLTRLRSLDDATAWTIAALVLVVVVGVPMVVSGPGNDLDVGNVFRAGRSILDLGYEPSRAPGAPVHEAIVGVLDRIGGPLLTNLASLAAAVAIVIGLDRLLAGEGLGPGRRWAIAVLAANPWFLIAATSTIDYLFALTFVVWAAVALRSGRPVAAGVLAALAMGCRIGSLMLIAALLLAELTRRPGPALADPSDDADPPAPTSTLGAGPTTAADEAPPSTGDVVGSPWRTVVTAGAVTAAGTVLLFVPSFRAAGGLAFAQNDFSTSAPLVMVGRAAAKVLALGGLASWIVVLFALPAVAAALRTWRTSWLVRFASVGFVLSLLLFVRFPWKVPHLLAVLLCGVVLLAVALHRRPALLVVLVGLQLLYGVVRLDVVEPDNPNQAGSGRFGVTLDWGPLVTDWRCRRDDPDAYRGEQLVEIEAAWNCARPYGE